MSRAAAKVWAPGPAMIEPLENDFRKMMIVALAHLPGVRVWPQNVGTIPVRNERGVLIRMFDPGPPVGVADISGVVAPEGYRLEVELKSSTYERSPEQITWAAFCETSGMVYALYRYDPKLTRAQNVLAGAMEVSDAIERRRCA
jgi:hypothetical protein